ncbi:hypothetical protein RvY_06087, partial [Ramazzottius varieornatus]
LTRADIFSTSSKAEVEASVSLVTSRRATVRSTALIGSVSTLAPAAHAHSHTGASRLHYRSASGSAAVVPVAVAHSPPLRVHRPAAKSTTIHRSVHTVAHFLLLHPRSVLRRSTASILLTTPASTAAAAGSAAVVAAAPHLGRAVVAHHFQHLLCLCFFYLAIWGKFSSSPEAHVEEQRNAAGSLALVK